MMHFVAKWNKEKFEALFAHNYTIPQLKLLGLVTVMSKLELLGDVKRHSIEKWARRLVVRPDYKARAKASYDWRKHKVVSKIPHIEMNNKI